MVRFDIRFGESSKVCLTAKNIERQAPFFGGNDGAMVVVLGPESDAETIVWEERTSKTASKAMGTATLRLHYLHEAICGYSRYAPSSRYAPGDPVNAYDKTNPMRNRPNPK